METQPTNNAICGVILAGGQASRMNFLDKPLIPIANRRLIEYVIATAMPQLGQLAISVNRNLDEYQKYDLPLITDINNKLEIMIIILI